MRGEGTFEAQHPPAAEKSFSPAFDAMAKDEAKGVDAAQVLARLSAPRTDGGVLASAVEEDAVVHTMSDPSSGVSGVFARDGMSEGSDIMNHIGSWNMQSTPSMDEAIAEQEKEASEKASAHGHGHGMKPESIITACASAVINYLLMFGLCCAYGMIMFHGDHNSRHVALGVKMNLGTAFASGIVLAGLSGCPVAIGGPDLNPVVFLGGFIDVIARSISEQQGMIYPESGVSASSGGSGSEFCDGVHYEGHITECDIYHEELRATAIFAVTVSTAVMGLAFFVTGAVKLTRFVQYMPTSISEAFLSCIGYKVFLYAMKFSDYDGRQFMPAACIGLTLYFLKALHIGNPAKVMPLGLLLPVGFFYAIMLSKDADFDPIHDTEVMFPKLEDVEFWRIWVDGLGNYNAINWEAYSKTLPDLATMLVVVMLDCSLKIAATETKMPVKVYQDDEIKLYGASNLLNVIFGSSVGYMQLKFNVINYGVMNNTTDRRGGLIYASLCGVCFFFSLYHFNYLPRFFLSALLFFAGTGFVCENLWGSRKYLSRYEWMEVVSILLVFIFTGQLLYAVLWGGILCTIAFVTKCAKVPPMEDALTGKDIYTPERWMPSVHCSLGHICGHWLLVLRPKGFVFFGSAHAVSNYARDRINHQEALPAFRRFRYLCLDCAMLDGMDASASRTFRKLAIDMKEQHVKVLWSSLSPTLRRELQGRQILEPDAVENRDWFIDINHVVLHVEEEALSYLQKLQEKWCRLHPSFAEFHSLERERRDFEPFNQVFLRRTSFLGAPWRYCEAVRLVALETILWAPGDTVGALFLVHTGAVALFEHQPTYIVGDNGTTRPSFAPIAVYRQGWFLNREGLARAPSRHFAVAIESGEALVWSRANWRIMSREAPLLAQEIMSGVLRQQSYEDSLTSAMVGHLKEHAERDTWGLLRQVSEGGPDAPMGHTDSGNLAGFAAKVLSSTTPLPCSPLCSPRDCTIKMPSMRFKAPPAEISTQLTALRTAQAISVLGFWDEPAGADEGFLPPLSGFLRSELLIAFHTFAYRVSGEHRLPIGHLREALMYAGVVPGFLLEHGDVRPKLRRRSRGSEVSMSYVSEDEFLHIGHRALMASLSKESVENVRALFKRYDPHRSGNLGIYELTEIFVQVFRTHVGEDEIESMTAFWESSIDHGLDFESFLGLVSMFVRAHEQSRRLLSGLHAATTGIKHKHIDPECLFEEHGAACSLTLLDFREMCWAANWKDSEHAEYLDINILAMAVLQFVEQPCGKLPPRPKFPPGSRRSAARVGEAGEVWQRKVTPMSGEVGVKMVHEADHAAKTDNNPRLSQRACEAKKAGGLPPAAALHILLEYPESSFGAKIWAGIFTGLSVCFMAPVLLHPILHPTIVEVEPDSDGDRWLWSEFGWEYMEAGLSVVFTMEYAVRLYLAKAWGRQSRWLFVTKRQNVCDLLAVLPFWLELILFNVGGEEKLLFVVMLARFMRLVRVNRIVRTANRFAKFSIVGPAMVCAVVILFIYSTKGV